MSESGTQASRVQRFTTDGGFVEALDAQTTGDPQIGLSAHGVAVDAAGRVFVSEEAAARVARYDPTAQTSALPPPATGETANIEIVSGTVLIQVPGSRQFVRIRTARQIPIGT